MGDVVPIFQRRGGASGASRPRACGCLGGFAPRSMRRFMLGASLGAPNRCAVETSSDGCGVGQSSPLRPSVCACVCVCVCVWRWWCVSLLSRKTCCYVSCSCRAPAMLLPCHCRAPVVLLAWSCDAHAMLVPVVCSS